MKKYILLSLILALAVFYQCKSDNTAKSSQTTNQAKLAKAPVAYKNKEPLKSIPKETIQYLYENSDYTDYIFHHMPFSMSQDDRASVQMNLSYILPTPNPYIPVNCTPVARQFFHVKGEIVLEVDVYYDDNCKFFVFVENEKPKYANMMSESGINFLQGIIDQAMGKK